MARCLRQCPLAFALAGNGLGCSIPHDPFLVGSRLDVVVFALAAAPKFARPPDGSDRFPSPEDFYLSLRHRRSPAVDVRHCYAANPGNCCDGTFTRMVNAVTGCTLHTA